MHWRRLPRFTDEFERDAILIPVATEDDVTIRLVPLEQVTYCDTEWLRQGFFPMSFDEQVNFILRAALAHFVTPRPADTKCVGSTQREN